jgi:RHS repeat-associated protein
MKPMTLKFTAASFVFALLLTAEDASAQCCGGGGGSASPMPMPVLDRFNDAAREPSSAFSEVMVRFIYPINTPQNELLPAKIGIGDRIEPLPANGVVRVRLNRKKGGSTSNYRTTLPALGENVPFKLYDQNAQDTVYGNPGNPPIAPLPYGGGATAEIHSVASSGGAASGGSSSSSSGGVGSGADSSSPGESECNDPPTTSTDLPEASESPRDETESTPTIDLDKDHANKSASEKEERKQSTHTGQSETSPVGGADPNKTGAPASDVDPGGMLPPPAGGGMLTDFGPRNLLRFSLGDAKYGSGTAGSLVAHDGIDPNLISPTDAGYFRVRGTKATETVKIESNGVIDRVKSPNGLTVFTQAVAATAPNAKLEVRAYKNDQFSPGGDFPLYTTAVPFRTTTIEKLTTGAPTVDGVTLANGLRTTTQEPNLPAYQSTTWTQTSGIGSTTVGSLIHLYTYDSKLLADGVTLAVTKKHSQRSVVAAGATAQRVVTIVESIIPAAAAEYVIGSTRETFQMFPWGEELIKKELDYTSATPLITDYAYYGDVTDAQAPNYAKLKVRINPDGSWEAHTFESTAASPSSWPAFTHTKLEPWLDMAPPALTATAAAITGLFPTGKVTIIKTNGERRTSTETRVQDHRVAFSELTSASENHTVQDTQTWANATDFSMRRTTKYVKAEVQPEGGPTVTPELAGRTSKIITLKHGAEDFTTYANWLHSTTYVYSTGSIGSLSDPVFTASTTYRAADPYSCVDEISDEFRARPTKTRTVTAVATGAVFIRQRYVKDGTSWVLLEDLHYSYDSAGRPAGTFTSGLQTSSDSYPDNYTSLHTSTEGVVTKTTKDIFGRVTEERILGAPAVIVSGLSIPAQQDMVKTFIYAPVEGGTGGYTLTTKLNNTRTNVQTYDGGGRLITSTDPLGTTRTYAYANGGLQETVSIAGTDLQTTQRYLDGRMKSTTGPAVVSTYYSYSAAPYALTETTAHASPASPAADIVSVTRDGLGRTIAEVSPIVGAGGTLESFTSVSAYGPEGLLVFRSRPKAVNVSPSESIYEVYAYQRDATSIYDYVYSALSTDGGHSWDDANHRRSSTSLEVVNGIWCRLSSLTAPTDLVSNALEPLSWGCALSSEATNLAPWVIAATGAPINTVYRTATNGTNTTVSITGVDGVAKTAYQSTVVNGALSTSYHLYNGLPVTLATPAYSARAIEYNSFREQLNEISLTTKRWPYKVLASSTGLVTSLLTPTATLGGGAQQEDYLYYTGNDVRASRLKQKTTYNAGYTTVTQSSLTYYDYNIRGQLTEQWGDGAYPVTYIYDTVGRMTHLKTYRNGTNWAAFPRNPTGATPDTTTWDYAPGTFHAQVLTKTYATGPALAYTYYPDGSLLTRTWQRGVVTTYGYDDYARLLSIAYADGTPGVSYIYDVAGRVHSRTDAAGVTVRSIGGKGELNTEETLATEPGLQAGALITYLRDATASPATRWLIGLDAQWGTAVAPTVNYGFDVARRLNALSSGTQHVNIAYQSISSQPLSHSFRLGATNATATPVLQRTITYDSIGRVASVSHLDQTIPNKILESFAHTYSGNSGNLVVNIGREDAGSWKYTYDKRSQVTAGKKWLAGYPVDGVVRGAYSYDNIGNRTSSTHGDLTSGNTITSYTSNALNQYTSLLRTNSSGTQPFEVNGTRTAGASILVNGSAPAYYGTNALYFAKMINHLSGNGKYESVTVTQNSVPVESGFQYIPPPTESPTYDLDGNLLTDGRWTYTWDGENRLKTMTSPAQVAFGSTPAVPGTRLTMTYDGLSRRIAKKVEQQSATTLIWTVVEYQGYLYDGWNCIMCVRLNNDATATTPPTVRGRLASYVWGPDIGSSSRQGANWQAAGGVGGLLFVSQGTNVDTSYTGTPAYDTFYADSFFPLWDRMGNITGYRKASTSTTDSALATTGAMLEYDAFGKEIRSSGPAADKIPFHFSSKFTDIETGLNYYGYRYYDPVNGRWLGRDPIGERGGDNLYAFCENAAIQSIDILGNDNFVLVYEGEDSMFEGWAKAMESQLTFTGGGKTPYGNNCKCGAMDTIILKKISTKKDYDSIKDIKNVKYFGSFGHGNANSMWYNRPNRGGSIGVGFSKKEESSDIQPIEDFPFPEFSKDAVIELYHCKVGLDQGKGSISSIIEALTGKPTYGNKAGIDEPWLGSVPELHDPSAEKGNGNGPTTILPVTPGKIKSPFPPPADPGAAKKPVPPGK